MEQFIVFEGVDGSGKSTQAKMLYDHLTKLGHVALLTREPGGTNLGTKLRELLLHETYTHISNKAQLMLFLADRVEHLETKIRPVFSLKNF